MKRVSRPLAVLFAGALAASVPAAAQVAPASADERIEAALSALQPAAQVEGRSYPGESLAAMMRRYRVPAVSIAYVEDGEVVWARAYGLADVTAGRQANADTPFQAASISKPVAATGALALVEQGRLDLDLPVNDRLTSWRIPDNDLTRAVPVTLRHLLTHSGGLTVHGFAGYEAGAPVPTALQILDGAPPANSEAVRVDQQPGTAWRYSGGGFTVLQQLMSDAAGEPFPELMERLVLRPAGMAHSRFGPLPEADDAAAATGYRSDGTAVAGRYYTHPELAAAGLWTTPADLARWALAIARAHGGAAGGVLGPETARAMLTPGIGDWGLGMHVARQGEWLRFAHGGSNQGFRTELVFYPERREGVVVMTNSDNGHLVFTPIIQAIGRSRGWPNSAPHLLTAAPVPAQTLSDAVGRYANGDVSVDIAIEGERLTMSLQGGPPGELVPQREDNYIFIDMGLEVSFQRDPATGRIVSVSGAGVTLPRLP